MTLAAADGFRLSLREIPLMAPVSSAFNVIIPARALSELMRITSGLEEPVKVSTTRPHNQILFQCLILIRCGHVLATSADRHGQCQSDGNHGPLHGGLLS